MAYECCRAARADIADAELDDRAQPSRVPQGSTPTTRFSLGPKVPITPWGISQKHLQPRQAEGRSNQRRCSKSADSWPCVGSPDAGVAASNVTLASARSVSYTHLRAH